MKNRRTISAHRFINKDYQQNPPRSADLEIRRLYGITAAELDCSDFKTCLIAITIRIKVQAAIRLIENEGCFIRAPGISDSSQGNKASAINQLTILAGQIAEISGCNQELVRTGGKVGDQIAGLIPGIGSIIFKTVSAASTGQRIFARTANQRILIICADQRVTSGTTVQRVLAKGNIQHVITIATEQAVGPRLSTQRIITIPTKQGVVSGTAIQHIVTDTAGDAVIPLLTKQDVGTGATVQRVGTKAACHAVPTQTAEQLIITVQTADRIIDDIAGDGIIQG